MTRQELYRYFDIVESIKHGEGSAAALAPYTPREITDAIEELINSAKKAEREACAIVAEDAGEPAGVAGRGLRIELDPVRREVALEIARLIRDRRT